MENLVAYFDIYTLAVITITGFAFITLLVAFYNLLTAPKVSISSGISASQVFPTFAVIIPARNEETTLPKLLQSLEQQTLRPSEIIVVNDNSTDKTVEIVEHFAKQNPTIQLIQGAKLPALWLGKNYACHQGSQVADSEFLVFIDADVTLAPHALQLSFIQMSENKLGMFSVFPTQHIPSFGSRLVTPLMKWLLLNFLPLKKVFTSARNSFVAANGQFFIFNREVYDAIGGHSGVRNAVVEDMELARKVKRSGNRIMTAVGGDAIFCEMYPDYKSAYNGFSKNFYPGFGISANQFTLLLLFLFVVYGLPFIAGFFDLRYLYAILLIVLSRVFIAIVGKQPVLLEIALHPVQMVIMVFIGINSLIVNEQKKVQWKGRTL